MHFDEAMWVALGFVLFVVLVWKKAGVALAETLDTRSAKIKSELEVMLTREKRMDVFKKCLTFLDTRVELDQKGFKEDIFEH